MGGARLNNFMNKWSDIILDPAWFMPRLKMCYLILAAFMVDYLLAFYDGFGWAHILLYVGAVPGAILFFVGWQMWAWRKRGEVLLELLPYLR